MATVMAVFALEWPRFSARLGDLARGVEARGMGEVLEKPFEQRRRPKSHGWAGGVIVVPSCYKRAVSVARVEAWSARGEPFLGGE